MEIQVQKEWIGGWELRQWGRVVGGDVLCGGIKDWAEIRVLVAALEEVGVKFSEACGDQRWIRVEAGDPIVHAKNESTKCTWWVCRVWR